jgi:hypothetical protein
MFLGKGILIVGKIERKKISSSLCMTAFGREEKNAC